MTLHHAIELLLKQFGRPMSTTEIATSLNENKWYQKKDSSLITPFQIHSRTKKYTNIFNLNDTTVLLTEQPYLEISKVKEPQLKQKSKTGVSVAETVLSEFTLMSEDNFKSAATIEDSIPDIPGLYCIRIKNINSLPQPFCSIAKDRNHNIIYIGIASKSLNKRFLKQELRAKGHGTFFRSIGAILGYKPTIGSLFGKANKKNYTFSKLDEQKIIEWINVNLIINWVEFNDDLRNLETSIIQKYSPLFNLSKNSLALKQLSDLRAECVKIANANTE